MTRTPDEAERLEELGTEAIRDIEAADARMNRAARDLAAGRIRTRDYEETVTGAREARRASRGILGGLRRATGQ
jgi:hypothetical protein